MACRGGGGPLKEILLCWGYGMGPPPFWEKPRDTIMLLCPTKDPRGGLSPAASNNAASYTDPGVHLGFSDCMYTVPGRIAAICGM